MCISPIMLDDGLVVSCRNCWQCRSNRVANWVGRNIAETETATVSYAVTFTYGRAQDGRADHLRSVLLTYSDIQKMLKRMRKAGMIVRYIICGEYGTQLGRAHWHGVFHFYGDILPKWQGEHLEWSQEKWDEIGGIHIPEWIDPQDGNRPMGFVHIKEASYAHVRYALKYLLKDTYGDESQFKLAMSRKPPLGYAYITQLARETAQAGLVPLDLKYSFNVRTMSGAQQKMQFLLSGKLAEMYLDTYIAEWKVAQPGKPRPASELVDTYEEWGMLGAEEHLTERAQEKLPKFGSIFDSVGHLTREVEEEIKKPRELNPVIRRSNIRTRTDWIGEFMVQMQHVEEKERDRFREYLWRQAIGFSQSIAPVTAEESANWDHADWEYYVNYPGRFQTVRLRTKGRRIRPSECGWH